MLNTSKSGDNNFSGRLTIDTWTRLLTPLYMLCLVFLASEPLRRGGQKWSEEFGPTTASPEGIDLLSYYLQ